MSARTKPAEPVELSIGALSLATGVPVETLRTWERRYGFPVPVTRTDGSHRRYAAKTADTVRLIVQALGQGHRPSAVVGRDPEELRELLQLAAPPPPQLSPSTEREAIARSLSSTRRFDAEGLANEFELGLAAMPAVDFLERRLGPYLVEVGERWARGELGVSHEHFASERAREFLSSHWRALAEGARRASATVVLATPPGELHVLGLHMAAWVITLAGAKVIFLGADTPAADVAFAAESHGASGIALSVAAGYGGDLAAHLAELGRRSSPGVRVAVGGAGAPAAAKPAKYLNSFSELGHWVRRLPEGRPRS